MSSKTKENRQRAQPLDKNGFIPLYAQIQRLLMQEIQSGGLREGDPLPSEEELSRSYSVSRMTARQALHGLKTGGYAYSEKGRGTFVTRPKLEKNIMHLLGFTQEMTQRGLKPSSRLLGQQVIVPDAELAAQLKAEPGARALRLKRLRMADGTPMALEESFVPLQLFPGIEQIDFGTHSLYRELREHYGVRIGYADEVIESQLATREEAELLTVPKKAPLLSIRRVIMTAQETPIEVAWSRYRGDSYRVSLRVPMTDIE